VSDLRRRLTKAAVEALGEHVYEASAAHATIQEAYWPVIEAELQKRDKEHFDSLVKAESECLEETEQLSAKLNETNKLLEQTIEVLEGSPLYETSDHDCCDECDWWLDRVQPLLDNLKARKSNG
jgi:hypothetical protein